MSSALGLIRPEALPLLGLVLLLAVVAVWAEFRRRRALVAFAGRGADLASVHGGRRRLKLALALGALVLTVLALAGPYVNVVEREVVQSGVDLVVALDVSQSMGVADVEPQDRLRAAKSFIERLGNELTQTRVALVLFAGEAVQRYPATDDPAVLGKALQQIGGGFKPQQGGSSLSVGVAAAFEALPDDVRESERSKAIVLVSDGEDMSGALPDLVRLRDSNTRVYAIGVGTPSGGWVPAYDRFGRFDRYLANADGSRIVSRLDEDTLRAIAEGTGGRYLRLLTEISTVNVLVAELQRLDASELSGSAGVTVPEDGYQILLALAVALLIVEEMISDRRRMPRPRTLRPRGAGPRLRVPRPSFGRASLALMAAASLTLASCTETLANEADRLYLAGDHQGALARYRQLISQEPRLQELRVNAGNALHQLGELEAALAEYQIAIRDGREAVAAVAHYQRGNTLFRDEQLEEAREAYKDALRIDPSDRDAKFNIEVIDQLLREAGTPLQQQGMQNPNAPGNQGGDPNQQEGQGSPAPGASGAPGPGQSPQPGEGGVPGEPGSIGPQASGPPESSSGMDQAAPTLSDILAQFRQSLTAAEALRLLDALLAEQRGIEVLLDDTQQFPSEGDPTY